MKNTIAALGLALLAGAAHADEHVAVKRPVSIPPSVDLAYSIKAKQKGIPLSGDAWVQWRSAEGRYSLVATTHATFFGEILVNRSEGVIDAYGIAPLRFTEKRIRHDPSTTIFDRSAHAITFSEGKERYTLLGGEQDRSSAPWQLAAVARAAPDKFVPGSEWSFFVAGRHDADPWTFKVVNRESVRTGAGDIAAVHLVKAPPPDSKDQEVDVWLAPSMEWYPVRVRFSDKNGDYVDQLLQTVTRR